MVIKLYIDQLSQPCRAVWAFCLIAKIPHEIVEIRIFKLQMKSEEFLKINPMGKVPAIVDTENNFKLAESHAIIRYLCNKYPNNVGDWYPAKCFVQRAKIDEYLDFHHLNTRKCSFYIFNSFFVKNIKIPTDPQYVQEEARKNVHRALKAIQNHYLSSTNFITGDKPTIADLSAFYEIEFLMLVGQNFEKYPKIKEWLGRLRAIPEVTGANTSFNKVIEKKNSKGKL